MEVWGGNQAVDSGVIMTGPIRPHDSQNRRRPRRRHIVSFRGSCWKVGRKKSANAG
jgi:hypothetical protein